MIKAVGLLSGGLDSTLAAKVLLEQGIDVSAINFTSPFCLCTPKNAGCAAVVTAVQALGQIDLKHVALGEEYLRIVQNPQHGYGSGLNPCIDCRIMKIRKAGEYMREIGAAFLFTGEVLGQRPMSQHRQALQTIDRESGLAGLIVRPLSARLLPPSIPEQKGWVDREKLLTFSGRTRKPQIALAERYEISDYPCTAGGCLLTVDGFVRRMRDLMTHAEVTLHDVALLKVGRHFRLHPQAKLIVGRDQTENERLLQLTQRGDWYFEPLDVKGPVAIGRGAFTGETLRQSVRLIARYCDIAVDEQVKIGYHRASETTQQVIAVTALPDNEIQTFRI
ncbi:thiamine biosynthesis protein [Candidatus Vecturithrix granuli]|uniref:Thiamine biosynthesis protein n=1 Tax=Vecturithrix granuli TaxID=1499967 RepID=A0A081BZH6_VECG1|nr:thiamine biosynthesis protein [Candidatus Vecturithrix granuli]